MEQNSNNIVDIHYVLRSLSGNPAVSGRQNLYKIGFSTNTVEERIANAEQEPTYLMAPVEIAATYKVVNLHSQKFEGSAPSYI